MRRCIRVRTTNLAERSFVEERRRTKVIPRFPDEKAAIKLVFATLIRAELGLDPPPANTDNRKTNRRKDIAA